MKLFLCGGGSGGKIKEATLKFGEMLDKTKPLLYIPLAMEKEGYASCYEWICKEMELISLDNIEMITDANQIVDKDLDHYCAIYIGGGNTFKLLKELKDCGAFKKIKVFIENNGIVFGGSAGAIIFGKDIDSCKSQDPNDVNLKDTSGFNTLNDISLLCHLNRNDGVKFNRDKNSEYLLTFSKKNKVIYLPDDDTIFISDNRIEIIGNSEYRVYENGKCKTVQNFDSEFIKE